MNDVPTATEVVVERLEAVDDSPECERLSQVAIEGPSPDREEEFGPEGPSRDRYADRLDYEDWVAPLKLTGGTVCLGVTDSTDDTFQAWYQMCSDTLHHRWEGSGTEDNMTVAGSLSVDRFRFDMDSEVRKVRPVPVEETPFMEGDSG